jgi:formylglycine-generating enzyme required for sulfatase activity
MGPALLVLSAALEIVALCAVVGQEATPGVPDGWQVSHGNVAPPGAPGYRVRHPETGIELVLVPAGRFSMGSGRGDFDEKPVHEVELTGFWIGRTEVTVAQWRQVLGQIDFEPPNDQGDDHPVVAVAWDRSQEFCGKLGLRLPTEAEWEYAAAGPEAHEYPWGNEWDASLAQWAECKGPLGTERTAPVGSYPAAASWCGALDMAGNVWEWCADWYNEDYYAHSPRLDPKGPDGDSGATAGFNDGRKRIWAGRRVVRGGCFNSDAPAHLRCAYRSNDPSLWHFALGLRVARDL